MTHTDQPVDDTVLTEIRRGILDRLALHHHGRIVFCRCTRTTGGSKVTYANHADAQMAAHALVQLPGVDAIQLYRCRRTAGHWHHARAKASTGPNIVQSPRKCANDHEIAGHSVE
jgi:hypothetical protein